MNIDYPGGEFGNMRSSPRSVSSSPSTQSAGSGRHFRAQSALSLASWPPGPSARNLPCVIIVREHSIQTVKSTPYHRGADMYSVLYWENIACDMDMESNRE